jgi:Integrase core domain
VLIAESCARQRIDPGQLTIHADRGPSMTSQPVALLLATLGVVPSHSRPHVSDDNPFSEAQFKTLKYRPDFPARFGAYEDAETFCQQFFLWYNTEHRHGALGLMTPHDIHYAWLRPSGSIEPRSYAQLMRPTRSASRAGRQSRRPCRQQRGSTSPRPSQPLLDHREPAHDGESQISDADCLIRLDIYRRTSRSHQADDS